MDGEKNVCADDLLGGLDISTTEEISIPDRLIDQVIGQDYARKIIQKAADQKRHVMMIGSPGTGKSMLAKALSELLPQEDLKDVLVYNNEKDENEPQIRAVPSGQGEKIIEAHREEVESRKQSRRVLMYLLMFVVGAYAIIIVQRLLFGVIAVVALYLLFRYVNNQEEGNLPNLLVDNSNKETAPFEDATGAHEGAILGDVRHDPYQSGGMSTPAHQRVESGAIHKSSNGVLFIDEINTLDVKTQQKLMTAIQEGEFPITGQSKQSSGSMVKTESVPTNFVLVAAGNMDAIENMHPALRDRIQGDGYELYFDDTIEDTAEMRKKFARFVAQEVERDGNIPHFTKEAVGEVILQARRKAGKKGELTLRLRHLGGLVRVAGDIAQSSDNDYVTKENVILAKERSRSIEQQYVDEKIEQKKKYGVEITEGSTVGKVNGLAVMNKDSGIILPVMAKVSDSQGPGNIIATGKLEDIAEEAVTNVSALIKDLGEEDLSTKDVHIQFVQTYEGVQGDSASVTVATAVFSDIKGIPVKQNVAMTGSLSVRGDVLPVGGVTHKVEAAAKAGIDTIIIPEANMNDVMIEDKYKDQVEIVPASHLNDVLNVALDMSQEDREFFKTNA